MGLEDALKKKEEGIIELKKIIEDKNNIITAA